MAWTCLLAALVKRTLGSATGCVARGQDSQGHLGAGGPSQVQVSWACWGAPKASMWQNRPCTWTWAAVSLVGPAAELRQAAWPALLTRPQPSLWGPGAQDRVSSGHFLAGGGSPLEHATRQQSRREIQHCP